MRHHLARGLAAPGGDHDEPYRPMKCVAPRCEDDADYVVHGADGVARPACGTHAAAAELFDAVVDVRPLPARASPDRPNWTRHA